MEFRQPIPSPRQMGTQSNNQVPENALDALLDELQTFAKPVIGIEVIIIFDKSFSHAAVHVQNVYVTREPSFPDDDLLCR